MPGYETTAVTRLSCSEEDAKLLKKKVENIIRKDEGQLLTYENWGVRRLASRHARESKGRYHYFAYTSGTASPVEIERNLKINEDVLFYLSVRVNDGKSQEDLDELSAPTAIMQSKSTERQEKGRSDTRRSYGAERSMRHREENFSHRGVSSTASNTSTRSTTEKSPEKHEADGKE